MAYIKREKLINLITTHHGKTQSLKERFLNMIDSEKENGCINWNGYTSITGGHGVLSIRINGKPFMYKAHRLSYQLFKGEIPKDKFVLHNCNNVKCVNINHLRIGTQKENVLDRIKDGTDNKGERHGLSKLTEEQVKKIKKMEGHHLEIAKLFNVSQKAIYDIIHGRTWGHIA
jgi:hypothetical protein